MNLSWSQSSHVLKGIWASTLSGRPIYFVVSDSALFYDISKSFIVRQTSFGRPAGRPAVSRTELPWRFPTRSRSTQDFTTWYLRALKPNLHWSDSVNHNRTCFRSDSGVFNDFQRALVCPNLIIDFFYRLDLFLTDFCQRNITDFESFLLLMYIS